MKKQSIACIALSLLPLAFSITPAGAATEIARVNGAPISLQDFNRRYSESEKNFHGVTPGKKTFLEDMIRREIGIQEAKKMGLDKDPAVIDRMNTVLFQAYLQKKLGQRFDKIQITDDEAESYYKRNPMLRTSHIFIAVPAGAKAADVAQAKKRIEEIYNNYVKPEKMSFAEVAQKYSEGAVAATGGDLDWQPKSNLDPTFYNTALHLSVGSYSAPVKTRYGWHIIKLTGKRSWDDVDHALVKQALTDEQRQELYKGLMEQLRKQANVVTHPELLKD